MKLEKIQNILTSAEIEQKTKENELEKIEDRKTNLKMVDMLQKLVDLKNKVNEIDRKIKEEAVGLNEYEQFKKDLVIAKNELLSANSAVSRFLKEKKSDIYSFDEIDQKIKNLEDKQNEIEKEEKIASQN